jgi:uncharacterized linocin/CFP29 family protein
VTGILQACTNKPIPLPAAPQQYPKTIGDAIAALRAAAVGGPYAAVFGDKPYGALASQVTADGRSFLQVIQTLIEGPVLWSPVLQGGLLLSTRGGDFELTIGQDLAIGYAAHDRERVQLYLTESFTFRVLQPNAAVEFRGRHT